MDIPGLEATTMEDSMKVEQAVVLGVVATQSPMDTLNLYGKYTPKLAVEMPSYS
jgi:hypothetical protein